MANKFEIANFNTVSFIDNYHQMMFDSSPRDVEFPKMDENGNIKTVKVPNRTKLIKDFEDWKSNVRNEMPFINLFKNPTFGFGDGDPTKYGYTYKGGKDHYIPGIIVGYNSHCSVDIYDELCDDKGSSWWQPYHKRLRVKVTSDNSDKGSNCCGNWYISLRLYGSPFPKSLNEKMGNFIPLTYYFEYKILEAGDKSSLKIGWERGKSIRVNKNDGWQSAHLVYRYGAQRGHFLSVYPGNKNTTVEFLIRRIYVVPGVANPGVTPVAIDI